MRRTRLVPVEAQKLIAIGVFGLCAMELACASRPTRGVDTTAVFIDVGPVRHRISRRSGGYLDDPGSGGPVPGPGVVTPTPTTGICGAAVDTSMGGRRAQEMADSLQWFTFCSPMYTDDQPFNKGDGRTYGPVAHIIPSPAIQNASITQFNTPKGKFIAVILVDKPSTPADIGAPYTNLKLSEGFNCVYLKHDGGADPLDGWKAFVAPITGVTSNPCPGNHPADDPSALKVKATRHPGFLNNEQYAPVARFHEGFHGSVPNMPLFGLKCGIAWCVVGPQDAAPRPSDHVGIWPTSRTWEVYGWNDEQHLAVGSGSTLTPDWNFNASVMASARLGTRTIPEHFDQAYIHVATIYLTRDPPPGSKYDTKWRLKKNNNYIFLRHRGDDPNTGWEGYVTQKYDSTIGFWESMSMAFGGGNKRRLAVTRMPHEDVNPAGTARFKWSYDDDDNWARCDWGCCEIKSK
jgi:hypothetical protein